MCHVHVSALPDDQTCFGWYLCFAMLWDNARGKVGSWSCGLNVSYISVTMDRASHLFFAVTFNHLRLFIINAFCIEFNANLIR